MKDILNFTGGYSEVNGLRMYYEIHGEGKPLVLIHGGGSTIETTFGRIIPLLAEHRQIIAVELQAHGHTNDRNADLSFEQDAKDVITLLDNLRIEKADILGFSNGGQTAMVIGMEYSEKVNKLIIASAFYHRNAVIPAFWDGFEHASLEHMPAVLQQGYLAANNDREGLQNMFNRDVQRMKNFTGWTGEQISKIKAPVLILSADKDVGTPEHAVEMYRLIPNSELAILPGLHGAYLGTIESAGIGSRAHFYTAELIQEFLDK